MLFETVIALLAGLGAGIVTGLVGASAVVVVTPMLISFLGMNPYTAIGISLSTDVIASSVSAYIYSKEGNINLRDGLYLSIVTVVAAFMGSWVANHMSASALGGGTGIVILLLGISFIRTPLNERLESFKEKHDMSFWQNRRALSTIMFGTLIGLITGIFGAGGGVAILIVLTFVFGYPVHMAVGTSVLIMTFNALSGAISHFVIEGIVPFSTVAICAIGAFVGAKLAATYANVISEEKLSKVVGAMFTLLGLVAIVS